MNARVTGKGGATELLARLLTALGTPDEGVGVVLKLTHVERGVAAEVELPSGDRYLVIVNWEGDRESTADHE